MNCVIGYIMADEVVHHPLDKSSEVETTDRGLFDFLGAKKDEDKSAPAAAADYQQQEAIATEFEQKVHVSDPEPKFEESKVEEEKKSSLLDKLHRSGSSSSSSSSDEEEVEEGGEKKKKKKKSLKEKIHKEEDTSVPVEKIEETVVEPEEKKGFLDKIKEKLPGGGHKKAEDQEFPSPTPPPAPPAAVESYATVEGEPAKEKKGILEKIKEKIPGYHSKTNDEDKKEEKEKE